MVTTGFARVGDLDICYETFGDPSDATVLLIMGLGVQLTEWEPGFCETFVRHGFHVVRYDHRDVGLSSHLDDGASYTLEDLADDAAGLLSALDIDRVHVVGASMGGMIAQYLAIRHPDRVLSLCSVMSTTGASDVGKPTPTAIAAMLGPPPKSREEAADAAVARALALRGGGFPFEVEACRERAAAAFDRAFHPVGKARHLAAVRAAGDRSNALARLRVPTIVIHGADDPLVDVSGGEATAAAIPGARFVVVPGMGHEIPVGARGIIVDAIVANARRVDSRR